MAGQVRATCQGRAADRRPPPGRDIISGQYRPPVPEDLGAGDGYDEPVPDMGRPLVLDRDHPSWAEVDAGLRERIGAPPGEDGRP